MENYQVSGIEIPEFKIKHPFFSLSNRMTLSGVLADNHSASKGISTAFYGSRSFIVFMTGRQ
jgi:putative heme iron utilization protein